MGRMPRGVVEEHDLPSAHGDLDDRVGERGLGPVRAADDDVLAAGQGLGLGAELGAVHEEEDAALGAGVFQRKPHEHVDQPLELHLAGDGLRQLDHRRAVEVPDRNGDGRRLARRLRLAQEGVEGVEVAHLAVGSPAEVAGPGLPQVGVGDRRGAARGVEAGGDLVGDRLVVDEAVRARGRDGALVEVHGVELASFDAGDLGGDEERAVLEVLRAGGGPAAERVGMFLEGCPVPAARGPHRAARVRAA